MYAVWQTLTARIPLGALTGDPLISWIAEPARLVKAAYG